jgi:signal peptidase II
VAACVGCDQGTKAIATARLRNAEPRRLLGGTLELHHAENTGGFLGLGDRLPPPLRRALFVGGVGVLLVILLRFALTDRSGSWLRLAAIACLLGGGAGNLVDRIALGHVRDFAILHAGPLHTGIFNLADVAVTVGCAMLALSGKRGPAPQETRHV